MIGYIYILTEKELEDNETILSEDNKNSVLIKDFHSTILENHK